MICKNIEQFFCGIFFIVLQSIDYNKSLKSTFE